MKSIRIDNLVINADELVAFIVHEKMVIEIFVGSHIFKAPYSQSNICQLEEALGIITIQNVDLTK
jgi:hypothetical protein